ncbi:MAG: hypothetical protein QXM96_03325 [Candidatus Woesearchaeota archaeon]
MIFLLFADKKLIPMTRMHKFFLNSFFVDDLEIQNSLPKLYYLLKDHLDLVDAILVQKSKTICIFSGTTKNIDSLKKLLSDFKELKLSFIDSSELKKYSNLGNSIFLYNKEV